MKNEKTKTISPWTYSEWKQRFDAAVSSYNGYVSELHSKGLSVEDETLDAFRSGINCGAIYGRKTFNLDLELNEDDDGYIGYSITFACGGAK